MRCVTLTNSRAQVAMSEGYDAPHSKSVFALK